MRRPMLNLSLSLSHTHSANKQNKDKFESTMNSAMYGNVMASAARDLQQVRK